MRCQTEEVTHILNRISSMCAGNETGDMMLFPVEAKSRAGTREFKLLPLSPQTSQISRTTANSDFTQC